MNAKEHAINQEMKKIQDLLATQPNGHRVRTTRPVARAFLLADKYVYLGRWCNPQIKSIGVGVYECFITAR